MDDSKDGFSKTTSPDQNAPSTPHLLHYPHLAHIRKARDLMDEVLKESGEARKQAIALRHVQYGGDLVDKLFSHSTQMEKIYSCFQNLFTQPDAKDSKFVKLMDLAKEKRAWFDTAKASQPVPPKDYSKVFPRIIVE